MTLMPISKLEDIIKNHTNDLPQLSLPSSEKVFFIGGVATGALLYLTINSLKNSLPALKSKILPLREYDHLEPSNATENRLPLLGTKITQTFFNRKTEKSLFGLCYSTTNTPCFFFYPTR